MEQIHTNLQLASDLRVVVTRLMKKMRNKTTTGFMLSLTERSTIKRLDEHQQLLPSELAIMEKINTQSMSQILNHLLELGLITRTASETDKRKVIIALSKQGQDVLHKARNERDEWLSKAIAEACTMKEQEVMRKALVSLAKVVEVD
jgi:DNA-binding MarR family transcriptional regulator